MRILARISPFALAAVIVFVAACDGEPTGPQEDAAMSASINGAEWAANYQIQLAVGDYYPARDELQITGLKVYPDSSTQQITVIIHDYSGPGTYSIGGVDSPGGAYYVEGEPRVDSAVFYHSGDDHTGSVTIASMDADNRWVTGSFHFRAAHETGEVDVTDGSFRGLYVMY